MRLTGWGTRTVRPISSVTSRKLGMQWIAEKRFAHANYAAPDSFMRLAANKKHVQGLTRGYFHQSPLKCEISCYQQKSPMRDTLGLAAWLFLAKNAQSLRHRRVAWLTAF